MEEAYTKDALESEEREKDLRNRLAVAEEKVLYSTSAVQSARLVLLVERQRCHKRQFKKKEM